MKEQALIAAIALRENTGLCVCARSKSTTKRRKREKGEKKSAIGFQYGGIILSRFEKVSRHSFLWEEELISGEKGKKLVR